MTRRQRAPKKELFGWAMFDFANSSYTTVIITVVYAVIFPEIIVGPDAGGSFSTGNLLWSIALSVSYGLVVLTAPVFGAIIDFTASKKKFLFLSYLLTIIATAALYFVRPGFYITGIILIVLSNFGFAAGESFVSSFLPDLGPPEDMGKISGYAWGLGYFGGLLSTILVTLLGPIRLENFSNLRFVGPVTAVFFLVAAIPTFLWVRERGKPGKLTEGAHLAGIGFSRLFTTFREMEDYRELMIFLISVFFAMAGLSIVISFAFIYGNQVIHWDDGARTMMFVITQFTAAGGAVLFGFIQDRIGAKRTFNITLIIWIFTIILIWATNDLTAALNQLFGTSVKNQIFFLVVGCLAGAGLGATQSASRAIVGLFSPETKSAEFFGFWGLSGKLAAILGILSLGVLQTKFGLHHAILLCSLFFILALLINLLVNYEHGIRAAAQHSTEELFHKEL
jgi:UMF1 family MFS transporter